jgi:hypothetical protein
MLLEAPPPLLAERALETVLGFSQSGCDWAIFAQPASVSATKRLRLSCSSATTSTSPSHSSGLML